MIEINSVLINNGPYYLLRDYVRGIPKYTAQHARKTKECVRVSLRPPPPTHTGPVIWRGRATSVVRDCRLPGKKWILINRAFALFKINARTARMTPRFGKLDLPVICAKFAPTPVARHAVFSVCVRDYWTLSGRIAELIKFRNTYTDNRTAGRVLTNAKGVIFREILSLYVV